MSMTEQMYSAASPAAHLSSSGPPAFSSNNPFRRPVPHPSSDSGSSSPSHRNSPPPFAGNATISYSRPAPQSQARRPSYPTNLGTVPPRSSSTSGTKPPLDLFDFEDRNPRTNPPNYSQRQASFTVPGHNPAYLRHGSVGSDNREQGFAPPSVRRPVSSVYGNTRYSTSDQSLFHSHYDDAGNDTVYEYETGHGSSSSPRRGGPLDKDQMRGGIRHQSRIDQKQDPRSYDQQRHEQSNGPPRRTSDSATGYQSNSRPHTPSEPSFRGTRRQAKNPFLDFDEDAESIYEGRKQEGRINSRHGSVSTTQAPPPPSSRGAGPAGPVRGAAALLTRPTSTYGSTSVPPNSRSRPVTLFFESDYEDDGDLQVDGAGPAGRSRQTVQQQQYLHHPQQRVLRRTNSNDSIFAPFHPPTLTPKKQQQQSQQHPTASFSKPPSLPSSTNTTPKKAPAPPPSSQNNSRQPLAPPRLQFSSSSRPRHTRSNSDSSLMEPAQIRAPHIPPSSSKPIEYASASSRRPQDYDRRASDDAGASSSHRSTSHRDRGDHETREQRRERHERHERTSSSRYKESSSSSKNKESSRSHRSSKDKKHKGPPLDTIDRMDVTGFFGPGSFHHDGPFDACTPHRNKNTKKAPVAAFPINGANNSLALDPNRDRFSAENNILMQGDNPAYQDFSGAGGAPSGSGANPPGANVPLLRPGVNKSEASVTFDPTLKATHVHGDTTMGLGSSTFLEGAPAPKAAVDSAAQQAAVAGLSRKKSLVQKIRGGNAGVAAPPRPPRLNAEASSGAGPSSSHQHTTSEPGLVTYTSNPSVATSGFNADTKDIEKGVTNIKVSSPDVVSWNHHGRGDSGGASGSSPSPSAGPSLAPNNNNNNADASSKSNGLLRRVRSLKTSSRRSG